MKKRIFVVAVFVTLTACSQSFRLSTDAKHENHAVMPKETTGIAMDADALSIYMGYQAAITAGDIDAAEKLVRQLVDLYPGRIDFYLDLGNIYIYHRKNTREALEILEKAKAIDPNNVSLLIAVADTYILKGERKAAIEILQRIMRITSERENVPLVLANLYIQEKQFEPAEELLRAFIAAHPDSVVGRMQLGRVYENMGRNNEAAVEYEEAFKGRDEDEILISLDSVYDKMGNKGKSIEVLEKFIERNPDFPKVRERVGLLHFSVGKYAKALEHFDVLLKQFPENKDIKLKAAYISLDGGFLDKAALRIDELLKLDPENQKALYYAGLLHKELKHWDKAIGFFEKVTNDEFVRSARLYRAVCYEKLGQKEKALGILLDIWTKEKDTDAGYFAAVHYKNAGKPDEAIAILDNVVKAGGENKARFLIAELLIKKGDFEKGIAIVREILAVNPDDPDALNFIGYSYTEKRFNLGEAEKMIKRALELKSGDPYIMDSLAWLYFMKGDYENARALQTEVLKKNDKEATLLEHMGDILKALGRGTEALEYYGRALGFEPENESELKSKIKELKH